MLAKVAADGKSQLSKASVVNFKKIVYNESMVYANGVFLILDPGYYEISLNLYSKDKKTGLAAEILVNNRKGYGFGHAYREESVSFSTIVKVTDHDSIHVRIKSGKTGKWADGNYFKIEKLEQYVFEDLNDMLPTGRSFFSIFDHFCQCDVFVRGSLKFLECKFN